MGVAVSKTHGLIRGGERMRKFSPRSGDVGTNAETALVQLGSGV